MVNAALTNDVQIGAIHAAIAVSHMQAPSPLALILTFGISLIAALLALWIAPRWRPGRMHRRTAPEHEEETVFLLDGEDLVDATAPARQFLEAAEPKGSDRARLLALLLPRYPELGEALSNLSGEGQRIFLPSDEQEGERLIVQWWDRYIRIRLESPSERHKPARIDRISLDALERELGILRKTAELAPYLVWHETSDGRITWANRAYLETARELAPEKGAPGAWPPHRIFPSLSALPDRDCLKSRRVSAGGEGEKRRWFECSSCSMGDGLMFFAVPADALVRAENALQNFIQTLSLTFAHLPTGLAIFDRKRQLTLFNPALTDLFGLPVDFLSARPTLNAFLNRLREKQMIPEPKDFKGWRQQMEDLETKAVNGTYEEIWNLPGNKTYKIIGRPHPDGAVAFLFEDISTEVSHTRRFISQIETDQAVFDSLDEAIAVFAPDGTLTTSNAAYARLWGVDPASAFGDMRFSDAMQHWRKASGADPSDPGAWERMQSFFTHHGNREKQTGAIALQDGRRLLFRLMPLPGGMGLIGFREITADPGPGGIRGKIPWAARKVRA